jgi:hypothetical protein
MDFGDRRIAQSGASVLPIDFVSYGLKRIGADTPPVVILHCLTPCCGDPGVPAASYAKRTMLVGGGSSDGIG